MQYIQALPDAGYDLNPARNKSFTLFVIDDESPHIFATTIAGRQELIDYVRNADVELFTAWTGRYSTDIFRVDVSRLP